MCSYIHTLDKLLKVHILRFAQSYVFFLSVNLYLSYAAQSVECTPRFIINLDRINTLNLIKQVLGEWERAGKRGRDCIENMKG